MVSVARDWIRLVERGIAIGLLVVAAAFPAAAEPVEGQDYFLVSPALPPADPARVVVTEYFSYACPHCFGFAPALKRWEASKPADVVLERVAVTIGNDNWILPAALYYTLRSLGKDKELDDAVFNAIHRERTNLFAVAPAADWAAARGLDRTKFLQTLNSFATQSFVARADDRGLLVRLRGVPTLVVDGKYMVLINDGGDLVAQMANVDALVERVRRERGLPSP
jgi:thiol:disulfide interchange protein DsbA